MNRLHRLAVSERVATREAHGGVNFNRRASFLYRPIELGRADGCRGTHRTMVGIDGTLQLELGVPVRTPRLVHSAQLDGWPERKAGDRRGWQCRRRLLSVAEALAQGSGQPLEARVLLLELPCCSVAPREEHCQQAVPYPLMAAPKGRRFPVIATGRLGGSTATAVARLLCWRRLQPVGAPLVSK